jgi:hypothetical protein
MKREYGKSFSDDVKVDKYSLDEEMEMNPSLLDKYGTLYADARSDQDTLETKIKFLSAKKELEYRRSPPTDIKVTESVIEALVNSDLEIKELKDKLNNAKEDSYTYYSALESLRDKGLRLHDLMELFKTGYFSAKN